MKYEIVKAIKPRPAPIAIDFKFDFVLDSVTPSLLNKYVMKRYKRAPKLRPRRAAIYCRVSGKSLSILWEVIRDATVRVKIIIVEIVCFIFFWFFFVPLRGRFAFDFVELLMVSLLRR